MLAHREYEAMFDLITSLPTATIRDISELRQRIRNPYYLSFQRVLGHELTMRVAQSLMLGYREKTEILFDEGMDSPENLEFAFQQFVEVLKLEEPIFLDSLQNKRAEFRDDKCNPPLQAADLLAFHLRRMYLEVSRGVTKYDDPTWLELHENSGIKYWDFRYEAADWERILMRVRLSALSRLGIWVPPRR
jgi:hypothetical protein